MDEDLKKKRRNIVDDYRKAVLASVTLQKHIEEDWNLGYKFYYGAQLQKEEKEKPLTPDIFLEDLSGDQIDIIGDVKRSVPSDLPDRDDETSVKSWQTSDKVRSHIETYWSSITQQMKDYDKEFENTTNPHDLFFLFKNDYSKGFKAWRANLEYASQYNLESNLNYSVRNNLVGLPYHEEIGSDVKTLRISKEGEFSNPQLNDFFEESECELKYDKCARVIEEKQIAVVDEAHNTPIEYVMLILWLTIFDEINRKVYSEDLLERVKKYEKDEEVMIEADLDSIVNYLDKYYVLDVYDTRDGSQDYREQFSRKLVKKAMKKFEKIDLVDVERVQKGDNPRYEVIYEPLTEKTAQDALGSIVESLDNKGILTREGKEPDRSKQKSFSDF